MIAAPSVTTPDGAPGVDRSVGDTTALVTVQPGGWMVDQSIDSTVARWAAPYCCH
jgi:hypothetical protein